MNRTAVNVAENNDIKTEIGSVTRKSKEKIREKKMRIGIKLDTTTAVMVKKLIIIDSAVIKIHRRLTTILEMIISSILTGSINVKYPSLKKIFLLNDLTIFMRISIVAPKYKRDNTIIARMRSTLKFLKTIRKEQILQLFLHLLKQFLTKIL